MAMKVHKINRNKNENTIKGSRTRTQPTHFTHIHTQTLLFYRIKFQSIDWLILSCEFITYFTKECNALPSTSIFICVCEFESLYLPVYIECEPNVPVSVSWPTLCVERKRYIIGIVWTWSLLARAQTIEMDAKTEESAPILCRIERHNIID